MRLFQIVALTAFSMLLLKLGMLAATGAFDNLAISPAVAQEQADAEDVAGDDEAQEEGASEQETAEIGQTTSSTGDNADLRNVQGLDEIQNRSSRTSIAERLGERREALSKKERDLALREQLIEAAEDRLKTQLAKLKEFEAREEQEETSQASKTTKDLVTIYENMKPKDAAKIFNSLSLDILHMLATSMNPRKMSAILAEMDVKQAERLTVEMAVSASRTKSNGLETRRELPKIDG